MHSARSSYRYECNPIKQILPKSRLCPLGVQTGGGGGGGGGGGAEQTATPPIVGRDVAARHARVNTRGKGEDARMSWCEPSHVDNSACNADDSHRVVKDCNTLCCSIAL